MTEIDDELAAIVAARVGQTVCRGKYRIDAVLGMGGMAAVYAGFHRNGRRVAMKFLHPEYSRRSDIRKRFLREGQAANAVVHPGVVAVIDDDVAEDGAAFLVMERLEGKTLETLWEELGHRLPPGMVLAIGRDLCSVLAAAHRAGIVHRDIKPENIFLTDDGALKVLDFGLAQLRDAARPKDTHTGMVFGTPAFMPPEQASGKTSQIDARTDLWAVGATMFALLSGEMVHDGETAQHFVMLSATEPARSLRAVLQDAHPSLVQLVDRALTRDKAMRWQSADAMHEAIRDASRLLLGEADIPLPKPAHLAQLRRSFRVEKAHAKAESDEPTLDKKKLAPTEDTLRVPEAAIAVGGEAAGDTREERTKIEHTTLTERTMSIDGDSSAPPTRPKMKAVVDTASDAPTAQKTPEEPPTRIRQIPDPTPDSEQPSDSAAVMRKRASWSDLRRAIGGHGDTPRFTEPQAAALRDEPQPLAARSRQDQTALIASGFRSSNPIVRAAAPASVPAHAMAQGAQSYPALIPVSRASAGNAKTIASSHRRWSNPYLPIVLAAVLVGLSPIAFFVARDSGAERNRPPAPAASGTGTQPATASAEQVTVATAPAATAASMDAGTTHIIVATNVSSASILSPRPAPAIPRPSASAVTTSSTRASIRCTPPYDLDNAGIKHWRLECVEP